MDNGVISKFSFARADNRDGALVYRSLIDGSCGNLVNCVNGNSDVSSKTYPSSIDLSSYSNNYPRGGFRQGLGALLFFYHDMVNRNLLDGSHGTIDDQNNGKRNVCSKLDTYSIYPYSYSPND